MLTGQCRKALPKERFMENYLWQESIIKFFNVITGLTVIVITWEESNVLSSYQV